MNQLDGIDWKKMNNLIPAVVQDEDSLQVLMVGYMNLEALEKTLATGHVTFYSRSREKIWTKGETSGNIIELVDATIDCDGDAILVRARPKGPTCHKKTPSCFGADAPHGFGFLGRLSRKIKKRWDDKPPGSYTTSLFEAGLDRQAQKVGEEAVEVVIAAKNEDSRELVSEVSDLIYHLIVLLRGRGLSLEDVANELARRKGGSNGGSAW